jgi:DNA-binding transcriptional LysR family regulator
MDLKHISLFELEIFEVISRLRTIRGAARHLGLQPSHLSKIINRLEEKLGFNLLVRHASGVMLSRQGIVFAERLKPLLLESQKLFNSSQEPGPRTTQKVLTIGSLTYINQCLVVPSLSSLTVERNDVRFRIVDLPPDLLPRAAEKGGFDFVLHSNKDSWSKKWNIQHVGTLTWALISRAGHPLKSHGTLDEVLAYPFVVPTYWQDDGYAVGDDLFPVSWDRRKMGFEVSSALTAVQCIKNSDQLAFIPSILADTFAGSQLLKKIEILGLKLPTKNLYLVTNAQTVRKSDQLAILKNLKQLLA